METEFLKQLLTTQSIGGQGILINELPQTIKAGFRISELCNYTFWYHADHSFSAQARQIVEQQSTCY